MKYLVSCAKTELYEDIIPFWIKHTPDLKNEGFFGRIHNDLVVEPAADKGLVLNARILWTFSALALLNRNTEYIWMANRAYHYLTDRFWDKTYCGTYWSLDYKGSPVDTQKKLYGQAFTLYALAEYYRLTHRLEVLDLARKLFELIELHFYDHQNRGYLQTSNRDWSIAEDTGQSDSDMDVKKSMNTHLHLMEAYANLYRVWPDRILKKKLKGLIDIFLEIIIHPQSHHFILTFDEGWNAKSGAVSFGHEIEGSWLLGEAAEILGLKSLNEKVHQKIVHMVDVTIEEGLSTHYLIFHERSENGTLQDHTDWWQQAEAVVGLINAWQLTQDFRYLDLAQKMWRVIEKVFIDRTYGEWFYSIRADGQPDTSQFKVSEWKCPYHNARACMEIIRRLKGSH